MNPNTAQVENTPNAITVCSAHHSALSVCAGLVNVYLKFIHTEILNKCST